MDFPEGVNVTRLRAKLVEDPYSGAQTASDWSDPDELLLDNAFVASSSSSTVTTATRAQTLTEKSLFCEPDADVQPGDRVVADGLTYTVDARPAADVNPWTGWQPVREVPLTLAEG